MFLLFNLLIRTRFLYLSHSNFLFLNILLNFFHFKIIFIFLHFLKIHFLPLCFIFSVHLILYTLYYQFVFFYFLLPKFENPNRFISKFVRFKWILIHFALKANRILGAILVVPQFVSSNKIDSRGATLHLNFPFQKLKYLSISICNFQ